MDSSWQLRCQAASIKQLVGGLSVVSDQRSAAAPNMARQRILILSSSSVGGLIAETHFHLSVCAIVANCSGGAL